MKTVIGSAIGVLAVGLILIGAGLRGTASSSTPAGFAPSYTATGNPNVVPVADASMRTSTSGPVMVNCGAGQRALVRQVMLMNGEQVAQVACVADPNAGMIADNYSAANAGIARPVAYVPAQTSQVASRRVVYQQAPTRVERQRRSWTKPLLIIGGSTAAGAGIGGIVGGKKGALIGAALGGGASTIYEATRR